MNYKEMLTNWYLSIWRIDVDIKEMVGGDKKVKFVYCRSGSLWYEAENGFRFPVPVSDIGDSTFLPEDRAMLFMRYIRKELEALKKHEEKLVETAKADAIAWQNREVLR